MPSAEFAAFLNEVRKSPIDPDVGVDELRGIFRKMAEAIAPPSDAHFEAVEVGAVRAEWTTVAESHGEDVLLYIHGGGYVCGAPNTHRALVGRICKATGLKALSIDYRLAPEHPFPAAIEDCLSAYEWLIAQGTEASRIVIVGDSAGGGLVLALLMSLRDAGKALPAAAVVLSPFSDLALTGETLRTKAMDDPIISRKLLHFFTSCYLRADEDARNPLASPLYGNLTGLPPIFVMVGTAETLLDDSLRWVDRAKKSGGNVELVLGQEMIHAWPFFVGVFPEAAQAVDTIAAFIKRNLTPCPAD